MSDTCTKERCFCRYATNHSKELVKNFYHALKMERLFYKFQKNYLPLTGLLRTEEENLRTRIYFRGDAILLDDGVWYRPVLPNGFSSEEAPEVIKDIAMLKRMIAPANDRKKSTHRLIGCYLKHYFLDFNGKRKIRQTDMFFEFLFGIIGMLLFTVSLFVIVSFVVSKVMALSFGLLMVILTAFVLPIVLPFTRTSFYT